MDKVFIKIYGQRQCLWRAVDKVGDVADILVYGQRDKRAELWFFRKMQKNHTVIRDIRNDRCGDSNHRAKHCIIGRFCSQEFDTWQQVT